MAKPSSYYMSKRERYDTLRSQLDNERQSFIPTWRDCTDYVLPRRMKLSLSDHNKGNRRNQLIIDSTATLAERTASAGMMSGITSPARPWFRLSTPDPSRAEASAVKTWLHTSGQRMSFVFLKSNLYQMLPVFYDDMLVPGTAAMLVDEDANDVIRCYVFPAGSYMIANDHRGKVSVFVREFSLTVRQLVMQFGEMDSKGRVSNWENFSSYVKDMWDRNLKDSWIDVVHVIEPNEDYNPNSLDSKYKKFSSCYFERGSSAGRDSYSMGSSSTYLRESGYDYFPVLVGRWKVGAEDVYATSSPALDALGDIKQLQVQEKRIAQAVEKMVNPPMVAPTTLENKKATTLPGGITYLDVRDGQQGFRPAHDVQLRIEALENKQEQIRHRISRAFYEDLFLMLAASDRRQITAREVEERHEEKLLALGPVLEQLNQDVLDPLIDITFHLMHKQGMIEEAPEELQGVPLKVEYISIMHQAQKIIGISSLERFAGFALEVAKINPDALLKVDTDQMIDEHGDMTSVPPAVIRSDEAVAEMRAQLTAQRQAQEKAAIIESGAKAAKDLASAQLETDSALKRLTDQMGVPSAVV